MEESKHGNEIRSTDDTIDSFLQTFCILDWEIWAAKSVRYDQTSGFYLTCVVAHPTHLLHAFVQTLLEPDVCQQDISIILL